MAAAMLLLGGAALVLLSSIGVLWAKTPPARLHFVGPACLWGALLTAAAVITAKGISQTGTKALITALVIVCFSPLLSHATARASYARQHGSRRTARETTDRSEDA